MANLLFSIQKNPLVEEVSRKLGMDLSPIKFTQFSDGEVSVKPVISVRNKRIFLIHSLSIPVHDNLISLLVFITSLKESGAKEIILFLPYYCYSRQDRPVANRDPIVSRMIAKFMSVSGANRVVLFDIHSSQTQGFFDIPVDNATTLYLMIKYFSRKIDRSNLMLVSPDLGALKRVKDLNKFFNVPLVIFNKKRDENNKSVVSAIYGSPQGKNCLIVDDMIDTGGTIMGAISDLKKRGAATISVVVVHGVFSNGALDKFKELYENKQLDKIYVTNTIHHDYSNYPFVEIISIADLLSKAIRIYIEGIGSYEEIYKECISSI